MRGVLRAARCERRAARCASTTARQSTGSDTGNLIAELPGTAPGDARALGAPGLRRAVPRRRAGRRGRRRLLGGRDGPRRRRQGGLAAIIEACAGSPRRARRTPTVRVRLHGAGGGRAARARRRSTAEDVAGDLCLVLDADGAAGRHRRRRADALHVRGDVRRPRGARGRRAREGHLGDRDGRRRDRARCALGRLDDDDDRERRHDRRRHARRTSSPRACELTGECRSLDRERVEAVRAEMDARDARGRRAGRRRGRGRVDARSTRASASPTTTPRSRSSPAACRDAGRRAGLISHRRRQRREHLRGARACRRSRCRAG